MPTVGQWHDNYMTDMFGCICLFIFQCEKIRKKRSGMLGTIRIAQGNSIDDIDQRIMQARLVCPFIK